MATKNPLGSLLVDAGVITQDQLNQAQLLQMKSPKPFLQIISDFTASDPQKLKKQVSNVLELEFGLPFVDLLSVIADDDMLHLFPKSTIKTHKYIAIGRDGDNLTVAMVNPDDIVADKDLRYRLKSIPQIKVKKVVALEDDFNQFISEKLPEEKTAVTEIKEDTEDILSSMSLEMANIDEDGQSVAELTDTVDEAPIIQLANNILGVAISRGVSDIHIEPQENDLQVRYRQDGVLTLHKVLPKRIQNSLVARYKIMSSLDIAEKRLPQDGRIRVKMSGKVVDFRVSTLPSKFGEKIVMRILDKSNISLGLDKIITNPETLATVREMITRPFGIIFVTGPTGSGKTTTLYSALSERNTPGVNISTAEDPIEYDLAGITQSEVNKTIGMDFARILKAFLRQDPDIMLVGETRDKETAKIAIEAALTGHLVFTTLHTNDAPGAIMRLSEMDVEPFLIASSTIGIIAQRLLRRVCQSCVQEIEPDKNTLTFLGIDKMKDKKYYNGKGCTKCNGTGYKGRVGAYEVMRVDDHLRDLIGSGSSTTVLRLAAQEAGMKTLLEYSLMLAQEGKTTLDEVIRVAFTGEGKSSMCPECSRPVEKEFYNCPFCQFELKASCHRCGAHVEKNWVSCAKCGFALKEEKKIDCPECHGDLQMGMTECPWCFVALTH